MLNGLVIQTKEAENWQKRVGESLEKVILGYASQISSACLRHGFAQKDFEMLLKP